MHKRYYPIILLSGLWAVFSLSAFLLSHYHVLGLTTPDSVIYLVLAQNIAGGDGFHFHGEFISLWPLGYPLLIAVVELLFEPGIFYASKFLNLAVAAIIVIIFHFRFGSKSPFYFLSLFSASLLTLFAYSLSEAVFLLYLLIFVIALDQFLNTDRLIPAILIVLSIILMSVTRYIGLFAIIMLGFLFIYFLYKKENRKACHIGIMIAASTAFVLGYLGINLHETGSFFGPERAEVSYSFLTFLKNHIIWLADEINLFTSNTGAGSLLFYFITLLFTVIIITLSYHSIKHRFSRHQLLPFTKLLLFTALIYLAVLIAVSVFISFQPINYRLSSPFLFLILIAITHQLVHNNDNSLYLKTAAPLFIGAWLFLVPISLVSNQISNSDSITYPEFEQILSDHYRAIPDHSVVVFGALHLNYIRPQLVATTPKFKQAYINWETWQEFITRIRNIYPGYPVYLNCNPNIDDFSGYHHSVVNLFEQCSDDQDFILVDTL